MMYFVATLTICLLLVLEVGFFVVGIPAVLRGGAAQTGITILRNDGQGHFESPTVLGAYDGGPTSSMGSEIGDNFPAQEDGAIQIKWGHNIEGDELAFSFIRLDQQHYLQIVAAKSQLEWLLAFVLGAIVISVMLAFLIIGFTIRFASRKLVKPFDSVGYDEEDNFVATSVTECYPELKPVFDKVAGQAEQRKNFTSNVSHEFRTPLASLDLQIAMLEAALKNGDEPTSELAIANMKTRVQRLEEIVDVLLRLARLDNSGDASNLEPSVEFTPEQLAREVLDISELTEDDVQLELLGSGGVRINGDYLLLREALKELLLNAVKYSEQNVTLSVNLAEDELAVKVTNDGATIPEADLEHIFERFYKVDKARNAKAGGFGLGLSIVRKIVDSLGGRIDVTSSAQGGTVFELSIPTVTD